MIFLDKTDEIYRLTKNMTSWLKKIFFKENNWIASNKPTDFLVELADIDYLTARLLLHTGFIYSILFHSHQAIEKYLKAMLVQEKRHYLNTHSLKRLINKIKDTGLFSADEIRKLKGTCNLLDRQYETSRYGGEARYNFFVNVTRIFIRKNKKERKATKNDGFKIAGMIILLPNHLNMLDEAISIIRPKIKKKINHLKAIIEDDKNDSLIKGWRLSVNDDDNKKLLAISIKSVLVPKNNYLDELKK